MTFWRKWRRSRRAESAWLREFPVRSPLASWGQHFAVDPHPDAIYWARSKPARGGLRLREWGRIPLPPDIPVDTALAELARVPWVRVTNVEIPMRSPELRHRRISLPPLTPAQAHRVGHRKVQDFLKEQEEDCTGSFLRVRQTGPYPIWVVATPASVPSLFEHRWKELGFEVHRLSSESLALGNLTRILPPLAEGELCAILDLHTEGGDCVIADASGWHFNRMIPMRHGRARGAGDEEGKDEGVSRVQMDRVGTELSRTIAYVERELQLGSVVRLVLTGGFPELELVREHLAATLSVEVGCIGDFIESGPAAGLPPEAARAVGLVLAPDRRGCSLLSPESKERRRFLRARVRLRIAVAAVSLLLVLAGAALGLRGTADRQAIQRMSTEMGSNERRLEIIDSTARMRERAQRIDSALVAFRRAEPPWRQYLELLVRTLPDDVAVDQLQVVRTDEGWSFELSLEARGGTVSDAAGRVAQFREQVARAPFFFLSAVEPDRSRQTVQDDRGSRVFFAMRGLVSALEPDPLERVAEAPRDGRQAVSASDLVPGGGR